MSIIIPYRLKNKWGYCNSNFDLLISCKYDCVTVFQEELAAVELDGKFGYINKKGEEVIPFIFDSANSFSEGVAVIEINGKYGLIDKNGKFVIQPYYYYLYPQREQRIIASISKDEWCILNEEGKVISNNKFSSLESFSQGLAVFRSNGKYGFLNKNGNIIISNKYDLANSFSEGIAIVKMKGKFGGIDQNENTVVPFHYDLLESFSEGIAKYFLYEEAHTSFIKFNGISITVPNNKYDYVGSFYKGYAPVCINDEWGVIDKQDKTIIPLEYESAEIITNELFLVGINSNKGYIDSRGNKYWRD